MCHLCNLELEGGKSGSWKPVTITSSWKPVTVTSILLVLLKFYYEQRPSFLPCLELTRALTHIHDACTHDFSHYAAFLLFLLNLSNKITAGMLDWLLIFLFFSVYHMPVLSPFLNGRTFVRLNILRTLQRTMIRFLIEHLVRRIWFGQSKLYFILNWLAMRCKLRPELAADVQQTAWLKM